MKFETGTYQQHPSIFIKKEQMAILTEPLKLALVGRIFNGSLSMEEIRTSLTELRIKGEVNIGYLTKRHFLLRFSTEADLCKCWVKGSWFFRGARIRVSKWNPDFRLENPSCSAPVWLALPELPCHLFNKDFLFSLARTIGIPITMNNPTTLLTRPKIALIATEVDLRSSRPEKIWIEDENGGFWQKIVYHRVPIFCMICSQFGHNAKYCKKNFDGNGAAEQKTQNGTRFRKKDPLVAEALLLVEKPHRNTNENIPSKPYDILELGNGVLMLEANQKILIEAKHREGEDQSIRVKNATLIVTEAENVLNGGVKTRISEEDLSLIQKIENNPVVSCNIHRTASSLSLRTDWTAIRKKESMIQTAGCLSNQAWIIDSQGIVMISDMQTSIKMNVQFEEQRQTFGKKCKIKNQSKTEIYKKREKQNARRKKKKYEIRNNLLDWYSENDL